MQVEGSQVVDFELDETLYTQNIVKMCCVWITASFSAYMLIYSDKYLEGSIFKNMYFEGIGSLFATIFTYKYYTVIRMRNTLQFSLILTISSYFFVTLLEEDIISVDFMKHFVKFPGPREDSMLSDKQ